MDLAFLNRLPLSPHQCEYVMACWKEFPQNERSLPLKQKLLKNIKQSGIAVMVPIVLLIWRQPIAVGIAIATVWVLGVISSAAIFYILRFGYNQPVTNRPLSRPPLPWNRFSPWDKFITEKDQLVYLIPRYLPFDATFALVWSLLLLVTLMVTRHWVTTVWLGLVIGETVVFRMAITKMVINSIKNRARAYAKFFNLEPEITPDQINPDHPRPVR